MKILEEDKSYYEGFVIETKKENKALNAATNGNPLYPGVKIAFNKL